MATKQAVLVGPGEAFTSPLGTTYPLVDVAPIAPWATLGFTDDGGSLEVDITLADVTVAEILDPVKIMQTARSIGFVTSLAESRLLNLQVAFGGGTIAADAGPPAVDTFTAAATGVSVALAFLYKVLGNDVADINGRNYELPEIIAGGGFAVPHRAIPEKTVTQITLRAVSPDADDILRIVNETT